MSKSVIHFSLEIVIQDENQYKEIVTAILAEFPSLEMTLTNEQGDDFKKPKYIISTGDFPWAGNLVQIAEILDRFDLKMQ